MKLNELQKTIIGLCREPQKPLDIFAKLNNGAGKDIEKKTHAAQSGFSYPHIMNNLMILVKMGFLKRIGESRNVLYKSVGKPKVSSVMNDEKGNGEAGCI